MPTARETLTLVINADASGAIRELDKVAKKAKGDFNKSSDAVDKWGARLQMGGAAAVGFAAIAGRALIGFGKAAEESALAQAKLDNVLATVPALAGANRQAFLDLASAIQKKTVADDDAVVSAQAMLGQFGLTQDQILGLTPLVVDLSRKMGVDLDTAAKTVGKAMAGNSGALGRVGIQLDQNAFATDRYAAVQQGLAQAVGGFAEREGKTFSGQLAILKNQLGEVAEGIGGGVVGAVSTLVGPVSTLSSKFGELDQSTQHAIGGIAAVGTAAVGAVGSISFLAGTVMRMRDNLLKDVSVGFQIQNLNGFGRAALGAGAAAGILGAAYVALQHDSEAAANRVKNLTDAVKQNGTSLGEEAANRLAKFIAEHKDMRSTMEAAKVSTVEMNRAIQGSGAEYDATIAKIEAYKKSLNPVDGQLQIRAADRTITQLKMLRGEFDGARKVIEDTNKATSDLTGTNLDGTKATAALGQEAQNTAGALDEQAAATGRVDEATGDYLSGVLGVNAAQRDQAAAVRDATQAGEEYDQKVKEATSSAATQAQAERDKAKVLDDTKAKIDNVVKTTQTLVEKTMAGADASQIAAAQHAFQRDALVKLADTFAPGSPARQYIDGLIAALDKAAANRSGSLKYNMEVTANGTFVDPATALAFARSFGAGSFGSGNTRANGGPVEAGMPFVVGERGPELFVPSQDGRIVPNNILRQARPTLEAFVPSMPARTDTMAGPAGATITVNQTINAIDPYAAAREASRDVAWALRTARY